MKAHRLAPWRDGNRVELLENGEGYFPRAFAAIAGAQHEVLIETFILFEDKVGLDLQRVLIAAAHRGVRVELTVDGFGSPSFSRDFLSELVAAGVRVRVFDPHPGLLGLRLHVFRRLHRKLLVVDGRRAFIGGINFSADHLADFGPEAKQDYAVELEGPVVADILGFMRAAIASDGTGQHWWPAAVTAGESCGPAQVKFVLRDNHRRRTAIEDEYRGAIRRAMRQIIIANAYFFPGFGFLRELRRAARRGVSVTLILQGRPDEKFAQFAARLLYRHLLEANVEVLEYCARPFHGKVALVDEDWATVGSSNLDPLSLSLNLESNVCVRDRAFVQTLRASLDALRREHCQPVDRVALPRGRMWDVLLRPLVFHCLRRFPRWAGWLPAHTPRTTLVQPDDTAGRPP